MNSRERVKRALRFRSPDQVPILHCALEAGLYEHGKNLLELWRRYPQDFGDNTALPIPRPDPTDIQPDNSYYSVKTDEWGVEWEHRIFGIMGHPRKRPLDDWKNLPDFQVPPVPVLNGDTFKKERGTVKNHQENYYYRTGWVSIFEPIRALRRFEDVLMDIQEDTPEINRLADLITDYWMKMIEYYLALGTDGIQFGDDFGSQNALLVSLPTWRRFFKPRYKRLMEPIKNAHGDIFFHSCGYTLPLIEELAELGINALWPQLNINDNRTLAEKCRRYKICLMAHPDRQKLMPLGTPEEIKKEVQRIAELFKRPEGGLIFYGEVDQGFPLLNVETLYCSFYKCR